MFHRLYLDTNILHDAWPRPSLRVKELYRLCKAVGVTIVLASPVEQELERQFFDDAKRLHQAATEKEDALCTHLERVSDDVRAAPSELPHPGFYSDAYTEAVQSLKAEWNIIPAPFTTAPVETLFEMAINRRRPFTGKDKTDEVIGFQNAVILFSILEDANRNPEALSAFVSADKVFRDSALRKSCVDACPQLAFFDSIESVSAHLSEHFREFLPEMTEDEKSARNKLWDHRGELDSLLEARISPDDASRWLDKQVEAVLAIDFKKLQGVTIEETVTPDIRAIRFLLDVSMKYREVFRRADPTEDDSIRTPFDEYEAPVQVILTAEATFNGHEIENLDFKGARLSGYADFFGVS
ncbi:MAG: PIN domain-containing protein [Bryobacteraceae bacterium]